MIDEGLCFFYLSMIGNLEDVIEEHASVQQVKLAHQQPILGTLDECFRLYTQEEQVGSKLLLF